MGIFYSQTGPQSQIGCVVYFLDQGIVRAEPTVQEIVVESNDKRDRWPPEKESIVWRSVYDFSVISSGEF